MPAWEVNKEWGLPEILIKQLEPVKEALYSNQLDWMSAYIGTEGLGKTTLSTLIAKYLSSNNLSIPRDYSWNALDCVEKWLSAKVPEKYGPHTFIVLDEAVMGLDSVSWQGGVSRLFNSVAATSRYKYAASFLNIPRLFMLNNRVREGRLAMLCRVYGTTDIKGKIIKGYFDLYNALQIQEIYRHAETRKVVYPRTKFCRMPFYSLEGTRLWSEYEEAAKVAKQEQNKMMFKWMKYEQLQGTKRFMNKAEKAKDELEYIVGGLDA